MNKLKVRKVRLKIEIQFEQVEALIVVKDVFFSNYSYKMRPRSIKQET